MNVTEIYPDLVTQKIQEDDTVTFRVCFSNGKPGAMVVKVDTINPFEEGIPYPAGDITVSFEASECAFNVADSESVESFCQALNWLIDEVRKVTRIAG